MRKDKRIRLILKTFLFAIFILTITYFTTKYAPAITKAIREPEYFRSLINSYGLTAPLIYILFQIMHVIIVVIPGEFVQIGGGYIFGVFFATLYMTVGTIVGEIIVFNMTRFLGYELINDFVPQDKLKKFNDIFNSPKSEIAMFVLFLIPGIPKDALVYAAGFTPIKPIRFLVISVIARFPGLLGSAIIGSNLHSKNYTTVIVMSIVITVIFVLGLIKRDEVIHYLHKRMNSCYCQAKFPAFWQIKFPSFSCW